MGGFTLKKAGVFDYVKFRFWLANQRIYVYVYKYEYKYANHRKSHHPNHRNRRHNQDQLIQQTYNDGEHKDD